MAYAVTTQQTLAAVDVERDDEDVWIRFGFVDRLEIALNLDEAYSLLSQLTDALLDAKRASGTPA